MAIASIAVDATPHNAEEERTQWFNVVAFDRVAENLLRHGKGDLVSLSGRVVLNRWIGSDGAQREALELIADTVISAKTVRPGGGRKPGKRQSDVQETRTAAGDDWIPD